MKDQRVILIVSAAEENMAAVKKIWEDEPEYKLLQASSQVKAKAALAMNNDVDLIFLDSTGMEEDGIAFLKSTKKKGEYAHIPIIVGAQSGSNEWIEKALAEGAEDFVLRPYNMGLIRKRVSSAINRNLHDRDPLTNLYTATVFYNQTKRLLLKNPDITYTMLYFNVKGFTLVNDFYGGEVGDSILKELAEMLREDVGKRGTYGRIIADNFVCCIPSVNGDEEVFLYHHIEDRLKTLRQKYHFNLECGIYRIEDRRMPVAKMCDRAKFALMDIKGSTGKRYAYYNTKTAETYRDEQRMIADMEWSLKEGQFFVMLQPIYDAVTERPVGAEALVRWKHPELGVVRPDIFIPLFEKNGFIRQLDWYVWEEVCKLLARLLGKGSTICPISVNVSRIDLYHPGVESVLECLMEKYHLPKSLLKLEITETAYTEKPQEIIRLVSKLRERGFELLMDDFGSGYSSLNMLKEMPIDTLKIDMKFMEELSTSQRAGNILISIVRMAKLLNMSTVAEGVETREQLEFLRNVGCDRIQGYYFSKPLTLDEYEALMEEEGRRENSGVIHKKGVLVIDDVRMLRKSMMGALGDSYCYFEAANGKEALQVLQEHAGAISIVITDIMMPEMDGFELIEAMKKNSVFSHIPIIVITASEERESEIKALKLGAMDVITKPYDPVIVSQRVKNVMQLSETEWLQMEMSLMDRERREAMLSSRHQEK